jgi:hypothetical protein
MSSQADPTGEPEVLLLGRWVVHVPSGKMHESPESALFEHATHTRSSAVLARAARDNDENKTESGAARVNMRIP